MALELGSHPKPTQIADALEPEGKHHYHSTVTQIIDLVIAQTPRDFSMYLLHESVLCRAVDITEP